MRFRTIKFLLFILFGFIIISVHAQMESYNYKRELKGVKDIWHSITVPEDLYAKIKSDLSDIRIYRISNNDTTEIPYLLRNTAERKFEERVQFKMINLAHHTNAYLFTFETPGDKLINRIDLQFSTANFDWKINLEGSNDQLQWYTILDDYRILSINNDHTNYKFTSLNFSESRYKFYRLKILTNTIPGFQSAELIKDSMIEGAYRIYDHTHEKLNIDKRLKESQIQIHLKNPVLISSVGIFVNSEFDYYRNFRMETLADSTKTETGWLYHWKEVFSGTLSSLSSNIFSFPDIVSSRLKITMLNGDNQPLEISSFHVKGIMHKLIARFNGIGEHFLVYGNKDAAIPQYDLKNFENRVPEQTPELTVGPGKIIVHAAARASSPLFTSKIWLWVIMGIVVILLGWFSIRMMRQ